MALLIRYRCHHCGAWREGAGGSSPWLRCAHCQSLIGYDWQTWFESPDYAAWMKRSAAMAAGFGKYQESVAAASKAAGKGRREEAERHLRSAVEQLMGLTPHNYPPEVHSQPSYRERYLRFEVASRFHSLTDSTLKQLDAELQATARKLDYRNPLPTLEQCVELLRRQLARMAQLPGVQDPDDMAPEARERVVLSVFVGAYLPMLNREQRLEALRRVHGRSNVLEVGGSTDELGFFVDWECSRCGLVSLQARSAPELMCPGCYHRAGSEQLTLEAVALRCGSCGRQVELPAHQREAQCESCGALVRRLVRTGEAERGLLRQALDAARASLPASSTEPPLPEPERQVAVLAGLARQAHWHARFVQVPRYVEAVRQSLPGLSDSERAARLARVAELCAAEGGDEAARELIAQARARLATG